MKKQLIKSNNTLSEKDMILANEYGWVLWSIVFIVKNIPYLIVAYWIVRTASDAIDSLNVTINNYY